MFSRSAPDIPGVPRAMRERSSPSAALTPFMYSLRMARRPWTSGGQSKRYEEKGWYKSARGKMGRERREEGGRERERGMCTRKRNVDMSIESSRSSQSGVEGFGEVGSAVESRQGSTEEDLVSLIFEKKSKTRARLTPSRQHRPTKRIRPSP